MLEIYLQVLINGLIIGSLYALVASGLSLIYNVNKFMHIAHGVTVSVIAYLLFFFSVDLGMNFYFGAFLSVLFSGVFGVLVYQFLYKPLIQRKTNNVVMIIASLAVLFFFENMILILFGADVKSYNIRFEILRFWGISLTTLQMFIIVLTFVIFGMLWFFLNKTKVGKSVRAVSDNKELAEVLGINVDRIIVLSFFVGSLIAGIGGILIGLEQNLSPTMGMTFVIKGFAGAIVGGITSIAGSVGGGYLIGLLENFGVWFLPSQFKEALTFTLLFVVLLIRPRGVFGLKERET